MLSLAPSKGCSNSYSGNSMYMSTAVWLRAKQDCDSIHRLDTKMRKAFAIGILRLKGVKND